jgi:DNA polymerase III subunit epsilon
MVNNILIIDTETTGLDPKKGNLIEVGCIFYNVPTKSIIHEMATLIYSLSNEAKHINLISEETLALTSPMISDFIINDIKFLMMKSDAIIAHYARFDKGWLDAYEPLSQTSKQAKWICSKKDIIWGKSGPMKLSDIAEYVGVPYVDAHRSLPDCHILLSCLKKLDNLDEQLNKLCSAT